MLAACGFPQSGCSGYTYRVYSHPAVPFLRPIFKCSGLVTLSTIHFVAEPLSGCHVRHEFAAPLSCISASSAGDGYSEEPLWSSLTKDFVQAIRSLFSFLCNQPRQLRYIEWPTFSSTFKTATLTLVLVALLIVALATVDSGLCYQLALFLRGKPIFNRG